MSELSNSFFLFQIFDKNLKFVGLLKTPINRLHQPNSLVLDKDENCLYVLNIEVLMKRA